jgi:site-specific DNA recombinase
MSLDDGSALQRTMPKNKAKRAAFYSRVSDQSQVEKYSLDAQERQFRECCESKGWTTADIYREEGKSAHSDAIRKRPVFKQLLDDAASDKFDVVVVHTLDRWARNLKVQLESLAILADNDVAFVSITENIDYSTPEGRLQMQMLGGFAEYFSESLAKHVIKGQTERAMQGKHIGGLPFGYDSCWKEQHGEKKRICDPEHPGSVHLVESEADAVQEMFKRYASGTTSLAELAGWLNDSGFRTRNTKKLADGNGNLVAGPRLFTTASIRNILHNIFYTGLVKHKGETYPGLHEPLVSTEVFEMVEGTMRKNSGRSTTLQKNPEREYLLKGTIRCAHCLMPMWAQTYNSGQRYYREHRESRSLAQCPSAGGSIACATVDEQMAAIIEAIELGPRWVEQVLTIISVTDEVAVVKEKRKKVHEKLRRLGKTYVDGLLDDDAYRHQKRQSESELESLVVPQADDAEEAGRLIEQLPDLWAGATMGERRRLLTLMLDAIYVDAKDEKRIVAIKPKAPFKPIFQVATMREGSGISLVIDRREITPATLEAMNNDRPPHDTGAEAGQPCSWWRRGRVELPVQKTP